MTRSGARDPVVLGIGPVMTGSIPSVKGIKTVGEAGA